MGRKVAIVGAGITDCRGRHLDRNFWDLAQMGTAAAVQDAGINIKDVEACVVGSYNDIFAAQAIPECGFTGMIGMANKRVTRVTNGGATGGHAMQVGFEMVSSGEYDLVICLGVEKATDNFDFQAQSPTPAVVQAIAYSWDPYFERPLHATASDSYAQFILAYMDEHPGDLDPWVRAQIVEILGQQAKNNPHAQRHEDVMAEDVLRSRYVVYPNRLLETCVYTEGAGGIILAADGLAQEICQQNGSIPAWVIGRGLAHEPYFPGKDINRHKVLSRIYSDFLASKQAYEMAGLKPQDIGVLEIHDAFIAQLMITCAEFGFVPLGQANKILDVMQPNGKLLLNPSGGLTFGGHFVGGSNMMSIWSARREMLAHGIANGMGQGTGASMGQYGTSWIIQLAERRPS